jgi:hypothetical protein
MLQIIESINLFKFFQSISYENTKQDFIIIILLIF